jgi:hypothetical protein
MLFQMVADLQVAVVLTAQAVAPDTMVAVVEHTTRREQTPVAEVADQAMYMLLLAEVEHAVFGLM